MPPLIPVDRLLISVVLPAMLVVLVAMLLVLVVTWPLVVNSWLPLIASVEVAPSAPAVTPVRARVPPVPVMSTRVPAVCAPTVTVPTPGAPPTWRTMPEVPLLMLLMDVVLPAMLLVLPAMLVVLVVTFWFVADSWPPLTASVDPVARTPGATLCNPTAPGTAPTRVASLVRVPPFGTVGVSALEYCNAAAPALVATAPVSWATLAASVGKDPAATLVI